VTDVAINLPVVAGMQLPPLSFGLTASVLKDSHDKKAKNNDKLRKKT
jgi:hypothetical protein